MSAENPFKGNSKRVIIFLLAGLVFIIYTYQEYFLTQEHTTPQNFTLEKTVILSESEVLTSNLTISEGVLFNSPSGYGLGNQLFFYAECYALSRNLEIPLLLSFTADGSNEEYSKNTSYRDFGLNHLSLPKGTYIQQQQMNQLKDVYKVTCEMAEDISRIPQKDLNSTKYFAIKTYCFSGKFLRKFQDELEGIRVNVNDPSEGYFSWKEKVESFEWPVGVHVRKGDIQKQYWSAPIDYFKNAMRRMKTEAPRSLKLAFFVFSDEIDWAREGLVGEGFFFVELGVPVYFVSGSFGGLTNLEELELMIKCRSIVISNSTFSWWAAYLMKDGKNKKIVIRPKFNATRHRNETGWNGKESYEYAISYPEEWVPMEA